MTKTERRTMQEAIRRDKNHLEKQVPEDVKKLVQKGLEENIEALKKLASS